jgi:GH15 family glucan-1,4-alpha-glucosidase
MADLPKSILTPGSRSRQAGFESALSPRRGTTIGDYGILGDCRAAALVSNTGSLDWLCWPRFDSSAIFAALLDRQRGGFWSIEPTEDYEVERSYLEDSNLLETRFQSAGGTATLTDLMPVASETNKRNRLIPDHEIIRVVECTRGEIGLRVRLVPRADYGKSGIPIRDSGKLGYRIETAKGIYWLRSSVVLQIQPEDQGDSLVGDFTLRTGQKHYFSFSYAAEGPAVLAPLGLPIENRIAESLRWWQTWAERANYNGPYREQVLRSALTLKLLSYAPSGAIIAAPTTSLPERLGGSLNWDYRYCWLRDASLTIRAMLALDYVEEADDFMDWMLHATHLTQPELSILYNVYGEVAGKERILDYLTGFQGSRPVRVGNDARNQFQLDVYGEVIDAAAQYAFHGRHLDREMQKVLIGFGNYVVKHWQEPDEGIWEPRTGRQHHTHSRLLCWTSLDRLVTLHDSGLLEGAPVEIYRQNCEAIRKQVEQRAWNENLNSYVSTLDGDQLDASLLLMSWYGFEKAGSPRMLGTHHAIRERLGTPNGLLYRYHSDPPEGAFAICCFWEAEYLALGGGSLEESRALFERLLTYSNSLGLYGEEIDPRTGITLGNFPQAFTHIGLISAALSIWEREKGERQLAHRPETARNQEREVAQ